LVLSNQICDDNNPCSGLTIDVVNPNQIFCIGDNSCEDSTLLDPSICSGYESCKLSTIDSGGRVECSGKESCKSAQSIEADGDVQCYGEDSCELANIDNAKNIICSGLGSCNNAQKMVATDKIECSGISSCRSIRNVDTNVLYATAKDSIKDAVIIANIVNAEAKEAGFEGVIRAKEVNGNGEKSLYSVAIFVKDGSSSITVNARGNNAGERAIVICKPGQTCTINCTGTGCATSGPNGDLTINCSSGATCIVNGCTQNTNGCARIQPIATPSPTAATPQTTAP